MICVQKTINTEFLIMCLYDSCGCRNSGNPACRGAKTDSVVSGAPALTMYVEIHGVR